MSNLKQLSALALLWTLTAGVASAYQPDPILLDYKGYSPMTISSVQTQAKRQEWKLPPPRPYTPYQRVLRNIYLNNWTGNFDEFGSQEIRERI